MMCSVCTPRIPLQKARREGKGNISHNAYRSTNVSTNLVPRVLSPSRGKKREDPGNEVVFPRARRVRREIGEVYLSTISTFHCLFGK